MKLNLGCGPDIRPGYVNVDLIEREGVTVADLSKFPWPFEDASAEEILMLDFFEHFSWRKSEQMLDEVWRVLTLDGHVDIQVPDFEQCANAVVGRKPFDCHRCEQPYEGDKSCLRCGRTLSENQDAAIHRLYGGQDYEGNTHLTAFTPSVLERLLGEHGFGNFSMLEKEHQYKNWNFKMRAHKIENLWGDE